MNLRFPFGTHILNWISLRFPIERLSFYRGTVLIFTFICYFSYHVSRRPLSIVKSVLDRKNCSLLPIPDNVNVSENPEYWCNWAPFNGENAKELLGSLDTAFLIAYAVFMFISGYIGERVNLRYFLTIGMILCGILNYLFGLAYQFNIHNLYYFIVLQVFSGAFSSTGWPAVVAIVGHWFGPSKRGLIFGIWNSHTSLGNIAGAAIAGSFVEDNWGLSFIVPGIIILALGIVIFLFLPSQPADVGLHIETLNAEESGDSGYGESDNTEEHTNAISLWGAIKIPGVIEFAICLFFAKLVSYTFLYWLPMYINETTNSDSESSAYLSISFDIGGIVGGIMAGYIADVTGTSSITCIGMLTFAIPSLYIYKEFGTVSSASNQILLFIAGTFVNGPYALITTAVSAELGTKFKSKSALATVSAIIDGTGSIGSAVGPSLAGIFSEYGWEYVFYMVMASDLLALLSLLRIGFNDWRRLRKMKKAKSVSGFDNEKFVETF